MNTGRQINAMVIVLFISLIILGGYTIWDPFRSDDAAEDQLDTTADRGGETFALNCRLCHGDAGQGGVNGGRLAAALPLDRPDLQGIEDGAFSQELFDQMHKFVTNTITCGRVGTAMPIWGETQGGTLNDEQIRQLAVLITGGRWELAREHADAIDAAATEFATVEDPDGVFEADESELVVSNAGPFSVGQFVRIGEGDDEERLEIIDIPNTGQVLAKTVGKTPGEFLVSGSDGIEVGQIIRLGSELLEVTQVRNDGALDIELDADAGASETLIAVSDPAFFRPGYVFRVGDELIQVEEAVDTGRTLGVALGRAETSFDVSGSDGLAEGMVIRLDSELMRVVELEPAELTVERGVEETSATSHAAGTSVLKGVVDEEEDRDTGEALLEAADGGDETLVVTGTDGLAVGDLYELENELVEVLDIEPARVHVERAVDGTDEAEHARRISIFEGNLLQVERGVDGTSAAAHAAGDAAFMFEIDVERAVEDSELEAHTKNAEIFLGNTLTVERGVNNSEPAAHLNGAIARDFPVAPDNPEPIEQSCGQRASAPIETPSGPTPTPVEGAAVVDVSLTEFSVTPDSESVAAGPLTFQVSNDGGIAHNFRVIATDLDPDALPTTGTEVDEEQLDVVGRTPDFGSGGTETVTVDLPAGSYVLICNVPTHYGAGMTVGFEVTGP